MSVLLCLCYIMNYEITLENRCEIVVVTPWVPEFHMLVCPPSNALLHQRNCDFCAIRVNVKQIQSVYKRGDNDYI